MVDGARNKEGNAYASCPILSATVFTYDIHPTIAAAETPFNPYPPPPPSLVCRLFVTVGQNGWRRPWDGMDGEDFVEWAKSFKRIAAGRHERPENVVCFHSFAESRRVRFPCSWIAESSTFFVD